MNEVTDPAILARLNAPEGPVTDPAILERLNAPEPTGLEKVAKVVQDLLPNKMEGAKAAGRVIMEKGPEALASAADRFSFQDNPMNQIANVARGVEDILGVALSGGMAGFKAAYEKTPTGKAAGGIAEEVIAKGGDLVSLVADTEFGQETAANINAVTDAWDKTAEKYPEAAQNLKDAGLIATYITPGPKRVPITGKGAIASGEAAGIRYSKKRLTAMLEPAVVDFRKAKYIEEGPLNKRTFVPDARTTEIVDRLSTVDTIRPNASFTKNQEIVLNEIEKAAKETTQVIRRNGNPKINLDEIAVEFERAVEALEDQIARGIITGDGAKVARSLADDASRLLAEAPKNTRGTAMSALQARKDLDALIKKYRGDVFNADKESGISVAAREIRNILNDAVFKTDPSDQVKDLLNKQFSLYRALDVFQEKAAKEQANNVYRAVAQIKDTTHLPSTPLALAATAGAFAPFMLPVAAVIASGIPVHYAFQAMKKGQLKALRGRIMMESSKAVKNLSEAKGAQMLAERGIILAAIDKAIASDEPQHSQEDVQKVMQANPEFSEQEARSYLTYLKGVGGGN